MRTVFLTMICLLHKPPITPSHRPYKARLTSDHPPDCGRCYRTTPGTRQGHSLRTSNTVTGLGASTIVLGALLLLTSHCVSGPVSDSSVKQGDEHLAFVPTPIPSSTLVKPAPITAPGGFSNLYPNPSYPNAQAPSSRQEAERCLGDFSKSPWCVVTIGDRQGRGSVI